jgi:hypothetical protein
MPGQLGLPKLKANHCTLHAEVTALFADPEAFEYGKTKGNKVRHHDPGPEKSHGRIEQRVVKATDYLDWFEPAEPKHWLGHAAENLALLRKLTLNLLRHDQTIKDTMRGKRIRAALCEKTLGTLLKLNISK